MADGVGHKMRPPPHLNVFNSGSCAHVKRGKSQKKQPRPSVPRFFPRTSAGRWNAARIKICIVFGGRIGRPYGLASAGQTVSGSRVPLGTPFTFHPAPLRTPSPHAENQRLGRRNTLTGSLTTDAPSSLPRRRGRPPPAAFPLSHLLRVLGRPHMRRDQRVQFRGAALPPKCVSTCPPHTTT